MKAILISALIVAIGVPAVALGSGEGRSLIAGKRNPNGGSLTRETQIISSNGTYSTRQSNLGAGGGAIYGCRAEAGNATTVTFNRDVSKCSYTATANGATPQALAVASAGAAGTAVNQVVVTEDPAAPAVAFHLQVIC